MNWCLLIALIVSASTQAFTWDDLWSNRGRQGFKAFQQQNYQKAQAHFQDDNWRGTTYYRAGDYARALEAFKSDNSVASLYNQANAYTLLGQYDEAISLYDEVLKQDPDHDKAKHNKSVVLALKEQKQQEKQQDSAEQEKQKKDQKNQESQSAKASQSNNKDSQELSKSPNETSKQDQARQDDQSKDQKEDGMAQSKEQNSENNVDHESVGKQAEQDSNASEKQEAKHDLEDLINRRKADPREFIRLKLKYEYLQRRDKKI